MVDANTSYNVLLGHPYLNAFDAIVSTPHLTLKYPTERRRVVTVRADQKTVRECYAIGLKMYPRACRAKVSRSEVAMADLDPQTNTEDRIEPHGELRLAKVGSRDDQVTMIAGGLDPAAKKGLRTVLWRNRDLFAWTAADMPRIHPSVITHRLALFKEAKPIAQKKRRLGAEKAVTVKEEVKKLKEVGFIHELTYTTWLANVVMVKKPSGKWRMCTNYTDLNKACPKD